MSKKPTSTNHIATPSKNCFNSFTVIHVHNEAMLKVLYKIDNVTIQEIIEFNSKFLKKNVIVFDIFRHPIEHKMSLFFEIIDTFHFNVGINDAKKLTVEKMINRFNKIYPHIVQEDYFQTIYGITDLITSEFDPIKGYMLVTSDSGVKYVKLRLCDATKKWSSILTEILEQPVVVVKDNMTSSKKIINKLYEDFKGAYLLPINYFDLLQETSFPYLSNFEKDVYFERWQNTGSAFLPYTPDEYTLYLEISKENKHLNQYQTNHYLDSGCECPECCEKRAKLLSSVTKKKDKPKPKKHFSLTFL